MPKSRQAVILIHGVGEQRPLDTLRKFVRNILGEKRDVRNKPDKMSTLFELRRLQLGSKGRCQPQTDFYEYYWAHHMRDTKVRMLISWIRTLMFRWPCEITKTLRPYYYLLWFCFVIIGWCLFIGYIKIGFGIVIGLAVGFFLDYNCLRIGYGVIDDAARYLNPTPDNVIQRNKIREEGIKLLDALHKSRKYNRIVIVGHSLGSVIAYDLIRLYWSFVVPTENFKTISTKFFDNWRSEAELIFERSSSNAERVEKFQQLQNKIWFTLRKAKYPWLIHDLITIGSPLAHAETLLAKTPDEFEEKKKDGEYPCAPPLPNQDWYYSKPVILPDGRRWNVQVPTHAVPFIAVRWTNIFFPHRKLILGDFIGGPLQPVLGWGIRDIKVDLINIFDKSLLSHTRYWKYAYNDKQNISKSNLNDRKDPTTEIRKYLRLDIERGKKLPPV